MDLSSVGSRDVCMSAHHVVPDCDISTSIISMMICTGPTFMVPKEFILLRKMMR